MKNPKVLKKRAEEILNHVSSGEEKMDVTGEESGFTDYDFDILRQHYAGTDFETEANSMCDMLNSYHVRGGDIKSAGPVFIRLAGAIMSDDNKIFPGFEPYQDFASRLMDILENVELGKSNITAGMDSLPMQTDQQQTDTDIKELPNIKSAQAKLLELEQYLRGMNLDQRQKWKDYLAGARKSAAVGDDSFNAMPELDYEDMTYLKESERQKMNRDSQKQAMLQQLVGVNRALPGI
jgi:hypothetical protein